MKNNTSLLKDTPSYAQGIARTLLQQKHVNAFDIARANSQISQNFSGAGTLAQWMNELISMLDIDEEGIATLLSQAWQVRRVHPSEWAAYEHSRIELSKHVIPKALREAPQSVVLLGDLGLGLPKLGVLDASDVQALQRIAFIYNEPFEWRLLSVTEYAKVQSNNAQGARFAVSSIRSNSVAYDEITRSSMSTVRANRIEGSASEMDANDAPIVRYIQKLLARMVQERASDVHFEPFAEDFRIRARVDGVLHDVEHPDMAMKEQLMVRLKIMAQLDIAEKRLPQDGRIKLEFNANETVDCRVSTLPTVFGEKIVVRFLNAQHTTLDLNGLGFEPEQLRAVQTALSSPHGMILMTGPTGSGKTVSLYACLAILNQEGVNISTVEDPVEIYMHGVNQVTINEKAGIDFATVLRAFLRQDPDILMVGEVRDLETADIAVKAAQTGHLVFSTLHTNDATMALSRLSQMGVTPYNVAASVSLIVAQRLVRKLCTCKQAVHIEPDLLLSAGMSEMQARQSNWQAYKPVGCVLCHNTGYIGRVGVFQVVPISSQMQTLIARNVSAQELSAQAAAEHHLTLRQAGLLKVVSGVSSLEEVMALTL